MKNLLFFLSTTAIGGAETNVLKISKELSKRKYNIFWCYTINDGPLLSLVDFDLKGSLETGFYHKSPVQFYKRYKKFLVENQIYMVFNFGLKVEIISRLLSKRFGVQKIISNIRSTDDWRKKYHVLLDRFTSGTVDHWVANSRAGKSRFIEREKVPPESIDVIYNFIEPLQRERKFSELPFSTPIKLGVLANVSEKKGYFDLVSLSRTLSAEEIHHEIIYGGIDRTQGAFEALVKAQGVESNFLYKGYISDKRSFFDSIEIFILPSYIEGMPTVLLEAMAYGKPVIATTVGGIPELVDDKRQGLLVAPGDIRGFVNAIKWLLENGSSALVYAASERLKHFEKDTIMEKWIKVIEST